jgi:hypothetical protein
MASGSNDYLHRQAMVQSSKNFNQQKMSQPRQERRQGASVGESLSASARPFRPKSDFKSAGINRESSSNKKTNTDDKIQVLETVPTESNVLGNPPLLPKTADSQQKILTTRGPGKPEHDRRTGPNFRQSHRTRDFYNKGRSKNRKGFVSSKADLAQNRFRYYFSPLSPLCQASLGTLSALSSSDLWPHTVAVSALDFDPLCPICLDGVNAGRALACGHVFCAVCIQRCLQAASSDPMLHKCPVCLDGELSQKMLKRCETRKEKSKSQSFSLVQKLSPESSIPFSEEPAALSCRFVIATGEGMMDIIEKERMEVIACKTDLARFRDTEGLHLADQLEQEVDKAHVEWYRLVGKGRRSPDDAAHVKPHSSVTDDNGLQWFYQRSDGSLDFLHPMHLRCLSRSVTGIADLPLKVKPSKVLEIEDWSDRQIKFAGVLKLGLSHLPEFPPCCRLFEVDLGDCVTVEAMAAVEKEAKDRARRRDDRERRKLKTFIEQRQQELDVEEQRRKSREDEENMIRAFFGFEKKRAEEELKESQNRPQAAVNSFSAVVANMGHFPTLQSTSPKLQPSESPKGHWSATSPTFEPLKSAWAGAASSPTTHSFSLSSSPPPPGMDVSFAKAATQGPGKKVLWQNNPGRRGNC